MKPRVLRAAFVGGEHDLTGRFYTIGIDMSGRESNVFPLAFACHLDSEGAAGPHRMLLRLLDPAGAVVDDLAADQVLGDPAAPWTWGADIRVHPRKTGRHCVELLVNGLSASRVPLDVVDDRHPPGHVN